MDRRIPVLETERLIVRELTMDDLVAVNNVLNRIFDSETPPAEHRPWLQWTVLGYEMFAMLEQPHYGERAIVLRETGTFYGSNFGPNTSWRWRGCGRKRRRSPA